MMTFQQVKTNTTSTFNILLSECVYGALVYPDIPLTALIIALACLYLLCRNGIKGCHLQREPLRVRSDNII